MSYLDVNLWHWFEKEANLRSGGPSSPFSLFVFPFPRPSTFALSRFRAFPQKRTPSGWQVRRRRQIYVSANIFFQWNKLARTTYSWLFSFALRLRGVFAAKKSALGETHLACNVSIFVWANESLVSLLCVWSPSLILGKVDTSVVLGCCGRL